MKKSWDAVLHYTAFGTHKRYGVLRNIPTSRRLEQLLAEVEELQAAPGDISEIADVAIILFAHTQIKGFTMEQLEEEILTKLAKKIVLPEGQA